MRHNTMLKIKQVWVVLGCLILTLVGITSWSGTSKTHAQSGIPFNNAVTGVWFVNAVGAPFQPHVATFHADGSMEIDNPEAGDTHTSDSMGMGPWTEAYMTGGATVVGKFVEVNADRTTGQYVSKLVVTYNLTVRGNTFTGPAEATYYNPDGTLQAGPYPATLNGTRITL